jgi:hypothetical protein
MESQKSKLNILWTNDSPVTAELMVFMYALNMKRKKVWDEITLILWGATVKLTAENSTIQALVKEAQVLGIHVSACKACSDQLGVSELISGQGIELIYWGEPLTEIIKSGEKLITI